jgi:hypothetical protein
MPKAEYNFLSERQREYLKNPDDFDSQRSAELAYRIRQKYAAAREDFDLLHEKPAVWDKKKHEISTVVTCGYQWEKCGPDEFGGCENTQEVDPIFFKGESGAEQWLPVPGWKEPDMLGIGNNETAVISCPESREKAREYAREHGTVPCTMPKHTSHRVGSKAFKSCYEVLALTGEDMKQLDAIETPFREAELKPEG